MMVAAKIELLPQVETESEMMAACKKGPYSPNIALTSLRQVDWPNIDKGSYNG